jgi:hypothetical protein
MMVRIELAAMLLSAAYAAANFVPETIPGAYIVELDESQVCMTPLFAKDERLTPNPARRIHSA